MQMHELFHEMAGQEASDLHITSGAPPMIRVHGSVTPLPYEPLNSNDTKQLCYSVLTEQQKKKFEEESELDFSFGVEGLSRFRGNLFIQKGAVGAVFRSIPHTAPPLKSLGLPAAAEALIKLPRGLILVTGPTGSGKSTTMAAMVDEINETRQDHIVTIEDPIEFLHNHKRCIVNQREVFADTQTFGQALKHILRQDPDVVLIGEMRDLETIEAALTIAETGHLVFATLHTNSAVQTVNRVIDVFPAHQQSQVRAQLSLVTEAVLSQTLLPRADGRGRTMACELMIPNPAIRNLIREEKVHQLYSQMQVGQQKFGMVTLSQSLLDLVSRNIITAETALLAATEPEELKKMLGVARGPTEQAGRMVLAK
ncbi:MAG: type IV pilus twitching motility protein PilT [Candidatus Binatia bacterium]|nr:type IV pilus twitching motility protein PilT [Candidatus Binatia bacterium]